MLGAGAGAGEVAVGAGAGAGDAVAGAGVAAAVAMGLIPRRARHRSKKPAWANCDISMTAAMAMRKHFRIS